MQLHAAHKSYKQSCHTKHESAVSSTLKVLHRWLSLVSAVQADGGLLSYEGGDEACMLTLWSGSGKV